MKHKTLAGVLSVFALAVAAPTAMAAPLPDNCTKDRGEVICTTFEGPGNNQAGVGETTETDTQGNTKNFSPEPQGTGETKECNPPKSQGAPCPSA